MKRVINILFLLTISLFANKIFAQQALPAPYSSTTKINYVRSWDPVKPYSSDADVISSSRTLEEVRQGTAYFDGLGRPLQTVSRRGSLVTGDTAKDLVSPVLYDDLGREQYKYLPFAANSAGSNTSQSDGYFKLNPFQQDSTFNKGMFGDETYYYSKSVFEASSLNRTVESYEPGDNWVGSASESSEANRHGVKTKSWINTSADSVRIWNVTYVSNTFGTYATSNIYAAGQLYKSVTVDEHNKQVIEFKDKDNKVVLKKVQLSADADTGTGKNHTGWLCTYYVYDDLGQLRAVIQPKGVEILATSSWSMTSTILDELCFRYEYDSRGLMILKKVPGAGIVYLIYDARDRLVMTQDSSTRAAHKWLYTLYDTQNRDTTTGLITDNTYYNDAVYHRGQAESSTAYPNPGSYTNEILTKKFYDNYDWRSWEGTPLSDTRSTTYDSYLVSPSSSWPYNQDATVQTKQLTGMVTGTKTKILGTSNYIYSVMFYDDERRPAQTQSTNVSTGTDINITQYSWTGQPLLTIDKQEKAGTNAQTSVVLTKITYDDLWRLIKTEKKISTTKVSSGSMPGSWTTINENEYDALGKLKKKKLGAAPLETLNYDYNIRGWLLGVNRDYAKNSSDLDNWFGFDLGYDKTGIQPTGGSSIGSYSAHQYNGNITGTVWKSKGDNEIRKYDFTYDQTNRFLSADFNQYTSSSFSKDAKIDFSVSGMSYDGNGNIQNMDQKGWKLGGSVTIDSLLYGYNANSNRLNYVTDRKNDSTSFLGDFKEYTNNTSQDYSYDGNGNLTVDKNKRIDSILYNHLNLPSEIDIEYNVNPPYSTRAINYTFDAAGNKLIKVVSEGVGTGVNRFITSTYINGFVYESKATNQGGSPEPDDYTDVLKVIPTEEGRARINDDSSAVVYDYMIKDHLGNVRMVLTEETRTDAYPTATMELADSALEQTYYSNLQLTRDNRPADEYTDTYTDPNDKAARLLGAGGDKIAIGPAIALKVMAGDTFNIRVSSFWKTGEPVGTPTDPFGLLLSNLNNSIGHVGGSHVTESELTTSNVLSTGATSFLASQSYDDTKPKAYVNWILFDERFNYVSSSSGFEQVGTNGEFKVHTINDQLINKSGFLYIYVSNSDPGIDVFFDNLQVTHIHGPLVEEEHFYPFGLTMKGISSQALGFGGGESKKKFQGQEFAHKEFSDGSGLEMYEFKKRMDDSQIGRFWQIDPLSDKYVHNSTYAFSENKVINGVELDGLEWVPSNLILNGYDYQGHQNSFRSEGTNQTSQRRALAIAKLGGNGSSANVAKHTQQQNSGNSGVTRSSNNSPLASSTSTVTYEKEAEIASTPLGDRLSTVNYTGQTIGEKGFFNIDNNITVTDQGTTPGVTLSAGALNLSTSLSSFSVGCDIVPGTEFHAGIDGGSIRAGVSMTNENGHIDGMDLKAQPGGGALIAAAMVVGAIVAPQATLPFLKQVVTEFPKTLIPVAQ